MEHFQKKNLFKKKQITITKKTTKKIQREKKNSK